MIQKNLIYKYLKFMLFRDKVSNKATEVNVATDSWNTLENKITPDAQVSYFVKQIIKKPRWILVFLIGRFTIVRQIHQIIFRMSEQHEQISDGEINSLFSDLNTKKAIEALNREGIFSDIFLPNDILQNVLDYVNSSYCYGGGKTDLGFKIVDKKIAEQTYNNNFFVAKYFNVSRCCPAILKLARDPKILKIAVGYIGKSARYTGASLYWTFPVKNAPYDANQLGFCQYHYDLDDYASVRFSFYLTDVTLESGPHICIPGSHRKRSIFHELNYFSRRPPVKELVELYGQQNLILTGKLGTGFIEDTFCFHRGSVPKSHPRLFLQLHFAANNYNSVEHHDYRDWETLKCFHAL